MEKKVTPMTIAIKVNGTPICHEYDWKKQSVKDVCKAGSAYSTGSLVSGAPEDWQAD